MLSVRDLPSLPALITVEQAAELVGGVSRATAYRRANSGDWPVVRDGGRLRVQTVPFCRAVLGVDLLPGIETHESNVIPLHEARAG